MSDWTEEKIAALRTMWADGHTATAISDSIGLTRSAITAKVRRLELPAPIKKRPPVIRAKPWWESVRQMRRDGMMIRDIAKHFNRSISTIKKLCRDIECPVDHIAVARKMNLAKGRNPSTSRKPRSTVRKPRKNYAAGNRKSSRPVMSEAERIQADRLRRLRFAIGAGDRGREVPSVTLPKLKFMSAVD